VDVAEAYKKCDAGHATVIFAKDKDALVEATLVFSIMDPGAVPSIGEVIPQAVHSSRPPGISLTFGIVTFIVGALVYAFALQDLGARISSRVKALLQALPIVVLLVYLLWVLRSRTSRRAEGNRSPARKTSPDEVSKEQRNTRPTMVANDHASPTRLGDKSISPAAEAN